jgi:WD40 repeat protein
MIVDEQGNELTTLSGHTRTVCSVQWSPDGTRLASGSADQTVRVWNWNAGKPVPHATQRLHAMQVINVAWSPDGQQLAVVGANRVAEIRNVRTGDVVHHLVFPGNPNTVYHSVSWSPDGHRVAVGDWGVGNVSVFDASTGELTHTLFERPKGGNQIVAWSPDGRWLATANGYFDTIVWDTSSWQAIEPLNDKNPFDSLACSPDGTRLAMGMVGYDLNIWEVSGRQNILSALPFGVRRMDWSPDGRLLAVATGQPILVDVSDGKLVCRLTNHTSGVSEVRWSPDGRRIATGGGDGVRIYDAATADLLLRMPCGKVAVTGLAWSPDGRRLAGTCSDGMVRLWGSADIESLPRAAVLETGVLARVGQ